MLPQRGHSVPKESLPRPVKSFSIFVQAPDSIYCRIP